MVIVCIGIVLYILLWLYWENKKYTLNGKWFKELFFFFLGDFYLYLGGIIYGRFRR